MRRTRTRTRIALLAAVVLTGFAVTAWLVPHDPDGLRAVVESGGALAPLAFVAACALLTAALFPGTVLAAVGGLAFGTLLGGALALVGTTAGAAIAYTLARALGRPVGPRRLRAVVARIEGGGVLAVAGLRSAPGMPATGLHYALGAVRIPFRRFVAGIALGAAPRVFVYGAVGGALDRPLSPARR